MWCRYLKVWRSQQIVWLLMLLNYPLMYVIILAKESAMTGETDPMKKDTYDNCLKISNKLKGVENEVSDIVMSRAI